MRAAGLDIGSTSIELLILDPDHDELVLTESMPTTPDLAKDCQQLLDRHQYDELVVTGYGRSLAEVHFEARSVTEIRAHARGARHQFPACQTLLDIGGQDTKAISLAPNGKVMQFEMNDRCAAGAGRFFELMARALGYPLDDFGPAALAGEGSIKLNSMCAVFAESEVVGLITRGHEPRDVALAVHKSVMQRSAVMLRRVGLAGEVVFSGGVARNPAAVTLLEQNIEQSVQIATQPHYTGALGAALIACE